MRDDTSAGVRLILSTSTTTIGSNDPASFTLSVENQGTDYVNYDSNTDLIFLTTTGGQVWSESCGFGRAAVVRPATISPGDTMRRVASYPSADASVQDCRVPAGAYSLLGRFRGCRSARPAAEGTYCDDDRFVAEITLPIEQK